MTKTAAIFSVLFLIGCGGSNGNGGGGGGGTGGGDMAMAGCSGSLSGAVTGSFSDCQVIAGYSNPQSSLELSINDPPTGTTAVTLVWQWNSMLTTGTYKNTDAGAKANLVVTGMHSDDWAAEVGGSDPAQGSYTLTLTSVTPLDAALYDAHGSVTATLPAVSGSTATSDLMLSMTF